MMSPQIVIAALCSKLKWGDGELAAGAKNEREWLGSWIGRGNGIGEGSVGVEGSFCLEKTEVVLFLAKLSMANMIQIHE